MGRVGFGFIFRIHRRGANKNSSDPKRHRKLAKSNTGRIIDLSPSSHSAPFPAIAAILGNGSRNRNCGDKVLGAGWRAIQYEVTHDRHSETGSAAAYGCAHPTLASFPRRKMPDKYLECTFT